jgi:hypothetical protein
MKCEPIDIKCPCCGELAKFEEPFEFLSKNEVRQDEMRLRHQWGSWIVIVKFPSEINWKPPSDSHQYLRTGGDTGKGGYPLLTNGLVQCSHCHSNRKHKLNWPKDAYWQWEIRGEVLWAWDKRHANIILSIIKETVRPSRRAYNVKYIPSCFFLAKVRDLIVQKMEHSIND